MGQSRAWVAALVAVLVLAWSGGEVWAAGKKGGADRATVSKPHRTVKVKRTRSSSDESRLERERRLRAECKGLPNAGACRGYTD